MENTKTQATDAEQNVVIDPMLTELSFVGAQYGTGRTRRHPSTSKYIFGTKMSVDIIDLNQTNKMLLAAEEYIKSCSSTGKVVLFVGNKPETRDIIKKAAVSVDAPYAAGRWIGGLLTNFGQMKKRLARMKELQDMKETGGYEGYTKGERALFQKELANLLDDFGGIVGLAKEPDVLFIVDAKSESTAVAEAKRVHIPVVALCGTDNDITGIEYPIVANDSTRESIQYFVDKIVKAFKDEKNVVSTASDEKLKANEAKS